MISLIKDITEFKIEDSVEKILDKFEKIMVDMTKLDLAQNLDFAISLQFKESLKINGKISSEERLEKKDAIETKKFNLELYIQ